MATDYEPLDVTECIGLSEAEARAAEIEAIKKWAQIETKGRMPVAGVRWLLTQYNIQTARLERREKVLERLQAIADNLPKTADGVPVVPSVDCVWVCIDGRTVKLAVMAGGRHTMPADPQDNDLFGVNAGRLTPGIERCYATPKAAEAAL